MSEDPLVAIRVLMPSELRDTFKTLCAIKKTSMNKAVVRFIEGFIEENQDLLPNNENQPDSLKELIRQNYFDLMNSGINQQRLKELAFGQEPSAKEKEKIKKTLGLDELPES